MHRSQRNLARMSIPGAVLLALTLGGTACRDEPATQARVPCVAVTTSWLECLLRDLAGPDIRIIRLLSPGMCPGHFDIKAGLIEPLREARLLVRFDFQRSVDAKLSRLVEAGLQIKVVPAPEGLSVPDSYLAAAYIVARALQEAGLIQPGQAEARLATLRQRLARLGREVKTQVAQAGLVGASVIASNHQAAFCRWLGLELLGQFGRAEQTTGEQIEQLLGRASARRPVCIVANLQQGRQLADALAERLGVPVVVFSNFPSMTDGQDSFEAMVRANVSALVEGARR